MVEYGLKPKDIQQALEHAKTKNLRIGEALIDLKIASDAQVYKALAQQHSMEYVDLDKSGVTPNAVNLVPDELMRKYIIVPLGIRRGLGPVGYASLSSAPTWVSQATWVALRDTRVAADTLLVMDLGLADLNRTSPPGLARIAYRSSTPGSSVCVIP